ncbi:MAG: hypothetical protein K1X81_01805 [Bacteroidia bacterium]|nr:hypothetical protein [Bacteroidia bacterium]
MRIPGPFQLGPFVRKDGASAPALDADAQAFITATGITDQTIVSAINELVLSYKSAGIWTKRKAIYPVVGGSATYHKFNLKDPRDLDEAFRLTFMGGITHSNTGMLPNGLNGYARTYFVPSIDVTVDAGGLGYYSRTNAVSSSIDIGAYGSGGENDIYIRYSGGVSFFLWNSLGTATPIANSDSRGWFAVNRTLANQQGWKNGIKVVDEAKTAGASNREVYLMAVNADGSAGYYSTKECSFAVLGHSSLTDAESLAEYNIIQQFQINLGRQV